MTAKIKLNAASGGGSFSLQAPSSSSNDRVMTLPDTADGTILTTTNPKTGNIIQVVQTVKTDTFSSSSNSYTDITGLSASITPASSSNKVKITVNFNVQNSTVDRWSIYQLVRGSTAIYAGDSAGSRSTGSAAFISVSGSGSGNEVGGLNIVFLDSPSTTSATTYKVQGKVQSSNTFYVNRSDNDTDADYGMRVPSSITLEEVAA